MLRLCPASTPRVNPREGRKTGEDRPDSQGRIAQVASTAFSAQSCSAPATIAYTYIENQTTGLGRVLTVSDPAGGAGGTYTVLLYDVLGRVLHDRRAIDVDNDVTTADMQYTYDTGDHLKTLTYPDGEVVTYSYDGAGRVNSLTGTEAYLINLTYDAFGRPRKITHPNAVEDQRIYGDSSTEYRLARIQTTLGSTTSTTLLEYDYVSYDAAGRLTTLNDTTPNRPTAALDNGARYTYDGLGRLASANGPQLGSRQYAVNAIGDITLKDGVSLAYGTPAKPHQATQYQGQALGHDDDGNRAAKNAHGYGYDAEDHLISIDNGQETFLYDYTGRRAVRQTVAGAVTRYYDALFEADSDGSITKYYVAGGLLIASVRGSNPQFAAAGFDAAVRLAKRSILEPAAVVLLLRRDVQIGLAAMVLLGGTGLLVAPPRRRRRVIGITIRPGHAVGAALVIAATLPWPIVLLPAPAEGQCGTTPIAAHYHLDHLGSTHLITYASGGVAEYVRYTPYGEVRGRYDVLGNGVAPFEGYRREFTGYETDFESGLEYAGARFYDPMLGMFQTHDPAGQSANPYAYTDWDPVNRSDPSGAFWEAILIAAIIGSILGATAAGIQAAVSGASIGDIFKAAAIGQGVGAASGALTGAVLQPEVIGVALGPLLGTTAAEASKDAAIAVTIGGIGQSAYSLSQGQYAEGSIGIAAAGVGLALALGQGANGVAQTSQTQPDDTVRGEQYASGTNDAGRSLNEFDADFEAAGQKYGVQGSTLKAIAVTESGLNPNIVNPGNPGQADEAVGIMQVQVPKGDTAQINSLMDPTKNIDVGAARFRYFLDRTNGNVLEAIGRYKGVQSFQGLIRTIPAMVYVNTFPNPPPSLVARWGFAGGYSP